MAGGVGHGLGMGCRAVGLRFECGCLCRFVWGGEVEGVLGLGLAGCHIVYEGMWVWYVGGSGGRVFVCVVVCMYEGEVVGVG